MAVPRDALLKDDLRRRSLHFNRIGSVWSVRALGSASCPGHPTILSYRRAHRREHRMDAVTLGKYSAGMFAGEARR